MIIDGRPIFEMHSRMQASLIDNPACRRRFSAVMDDDTTKTPRPVRGGARNMARLDGALLTAGEKFVKFGDQVSFEFSEEVRA